jgi:hypothetical protein
MPPARLAACWLPADGPTTSAAPKHRCAPDWRTCARAICTAAAAPTALPKRHKAPKMRDTVSQPKQGLALRLCALLDKPI